MMNNDDEIDILSPELREQLGDSNDIVIIGRKEKRDRDKQREDKANEEFLEEAKQLSKKAKKKLMTIQEKKEKDQKRDSYYEILKQNEISNEHRQLLSNTREANTMKNLLKKILKKYQAGLTLTIEEKNLLFPNGEEQGDNTNTLPNKIDDNMKEKAVVSDKINNDISINQDINNSTDLLFDMNDIYETSDRRQENKSPDKKKKKKNKKSKLNDDMKSNDNDNDNDKSTATSTVKTTGFGSQLMMQFQKLKENNALKVSAAKEQPEIIVNVENITSSSVTDPSTTDASNSSASFVLMTQSKRIAMTGMKEEEKFTAKEEPLPITNMGQLKVKDSTKINMTRTKFLIVKRNEELRAARMLLPVCGMEQEIVEKIMENDVVILCGETGSGKSTQVPQFLYEAGFGYDGIIGITQPRRVAAVSTACRVAFELGGTCEEGKAGIVGYQIRFDSSTVGPETAIKFMTDGILLREITTDFLLRKYSAIILDEAHERNTNTDVLLGMLSRAIHIRRAQSVEEMEKWSALTDKEKEEYEKPIKPLKLIIMSATMRIEDFQNPILFKSPPPIVRVEARQHPVVTHFSKRTALKDYLDEVHRKVCQIHRKLPDGGVLVFLTGKREILHMVRKLSKSLNGKRSTLKSHHIGKNGEGNVDENEVNIRSLDDDDDDDDDDNNDDISIDDDDTSSENSDISYEEEKQEINNIDEDIENDEEKIDEDAQKQRERMLREALGFDFSEKMKEIESKKENDDDEEKEEVAPPKKAYVLPLYAMMPSHEQRKIFLPPPSDSRLIVIATNVAETSITIPGIRYVVDCGRQKERVYENTSGISKFEVKWISKAAAEQRKGRAGRTGPGHCYRLYSSAFFDQHMSLYQVPEISRIPLDELVLSMRSMGIVEIENFPFPTPPPKVSLTRSLRLLEDIGAIPRQQKSSSALVDTSRSKNGKNLTSLGQLLAKFPINPRYSKMLVVAKQLGVITHALSLVAILSEKSPFLERVSSSSKKRKKADDSDDDDDEDDDDKYDPKKAGLWFHPDGDALARLRALGAYIYTCKNSKSKQKKNDNDNGDENNDSESVRRFCVNQNLHQATLERSFQIRQQIASLCPKLFTDTDYSDYSMTSAPPTKDEEASLRQILTSGSCDCIAKKVPINVLKGVSRRKRLTAYFSCNSQVTEPIYVHPSSALYRNNPSDTMPEYVTYNQLISNEEGDTTYMTCVTGINPTWIPSQLLECSYLKWGAPLESPQPFYDLNEDCVACYVVPKYGIHKWELPPVKRDLNELCNHYDNDNDNDEQYISKPIGYRKKDEAYRWFARLLLEGSIGLDLKGALRIDKLKEPSTVLTKQIPNVKAAAILRLLVLNKILTKTKLLVKLKDDPLFLSEEIQQFLSAENRKEFRKSWSNLT